MTTQLKAINVNPGAPELTISTHEWSINGLISDNNTDTLIINLGAEPHEISLRIQNSCGSWSDKYSKIINISGDTMEKTITVVVDQPVIESDKPLTPEQVNEYAVQKLSGCTSCGSAKAGMLKLGTATCGGPYVQNTTYTLTGSVASGGTAPFTYVWTITPPTGSPITLSGPVQQYLFAQVGIYGVSLTVSDSCPGGAKTDSASCQVTITAACSNISSCNITTCPPASIVQGTATSLAVQWVGGTPNFTTQLLRDGVAYGSPAMIPTQAAAINFVVDSSWTVGSHAVAVRITDSCLAGAKTCTVSACTINVTSCVNPLCNINIA